MCCVHSQVQGESTQCREVCPFTRDVKMRGNRLTEGVKQTLDEQVKIKSSMSNTE